MKQTAGFFGILFAGVAIAGIGLMLSSGCTKKVDTGPLEETILKSTNGAARLLAKAEVEAFYGITFKDAQPGGGPAEVLKKGISTCNYQGVEDPNKTVAIYLEPINTLSNVSNAAEAFVRIQEQLSKNAGLQIEMNLVPIDDVGERAGWLPVLGQLWVFSGDYYFVLMASPTENSSKLQASQDLAKLALARIPAK